MEYLKMDARSGFWDGIVLGLAFVFLTVGFVAGQWAKAESGFLAKPDPKEPPKVWKL